MYGSGREKTDERKGERRQMEESRKIKIALGQMGLSEGNRGVFRQVTEEMAKAAARAKAELLCLPELSSCGYFIRREELLQAAVPAEAEALRIGETAGKYGISIISGYPERDGDRIYNSCVAVKNTGELIGNVRKVNLWKSEKKRFSEGNDFPVLDTCAGKTAVILCYDLEFPEPARIVSMKGAELLICPAAWSRPAEQRWKTDLSAAALSNLVFAAGANYCDEFCCGNASLYGPDGRRRAPEREILLDIPDAGENKVFLFEIDKAEIRREREKIPYYEDWKGKMYAEMMRGAWENRQRLGESTQNGRSVFRTAEE